MNKHKNWCLLIIMICMVMLAACGDAKGEAEMLATSAAETLNAVGIEQTRVAAEWLSMTETSQANLVRETDTGIVTPTKSVATMPPVPTSTGAPYSVPLGNPGDRADFVSETISDGTHFLINEFFTKTWELVNSGSTTWTTDYALVYVDGYRMGGEKENLLPQEVKPGERVVLSLSLRSPDQLGTYRGNWKLRNSEGELFGLGSVNNPFWVEIEVVAPEATSTVDPSVTESSGNFEIQWIDDIIIIPSRDNDVPCDWTYGLSATTTIHAYSAGTVRYYWEFSDGRKSEEKIALFNQENKEETRTIGYGWDDVVAKANDSGYIKLVILEPDQFSVESSWTHSCGEE